MSASTPGNFDCARLLEIKDRAERVFKDDVRSAEYIAEVDTVLAIREGQTADLTVLTDSEKDYDLKVVWVDDCDEDAPEDCSDECQVGGAQAGTQCANYTLDDCFEKDFYITEKQFRTLGTITQDETVAKMLLRKMKIMDEEATTRAIAFLDASSGTNANDEPYTVSGAVTNIPATAFNEDLFGYLFTTQKLNKFPQAKLLTGRLLDQFMWKTSMETSDPTGQSRARKLNQFGKIYQDLFKLDDAIGTKAMFLFNPNSVAHASKNYFSATPREVFPDGGGKQQQYTMKSENIPGLVYDVIYQEICVGNDIRHSWRLKTKQGFYLNPLGCNNGRTGVLQFNCA